MPYDDLPLRPSPGPGASPTPPTPGPPATSPAPPASSAMRWVVVGIAALVAGAGLTFWWMTRAQPPETLPAPTAATGARASNRPQRQVMELPSLDTSDSLLRELVGVLSRNPLLARLMATDALVRNAVLAVDQIGDGRTPSVPLVPMRPPTRLVITGDDTGPIDPRAYARWDFATAALTSINPTEAAQLYVNIKPLFDAAYADLGHAADFDAGIAKAITLLLATPSPAEEPVLVRRPGYYEHADATLRSIRPVQKQLLLVGPDSRQRLLTWLRRFAEALDLTVG